ncbi:hypothetical protein CIPAW_03G192800 [Carya illinoinensis]|uniref:Uncharacterized protein n=1 Tax=Carya illinoinensis TaxID=32201 RepID=A0A8T1R453_CARIL|nr:hypothetical protein CIPAW_03G192800 [Carya illinoinensis]
MPTICSKFTKEIGKSLKKISKIERRISFLFRPCKDLTQ